MLTCKSPRKVMRAAHRLASQSLPDYSSKFSRKDFTLPHLFACLVVKEMLRRSYRGAEALLADCPGWLADIGLDHAPDHNTLWRASKFLLGEYQVGRMLDQMARWGVAARILHLSTSPLAIDSTTFESRHVSRHYERRCHQTRVRMKEKDVKKGRKTGRSETVRGLPKLAVAVTTASHLILSAWTGIGGGADHPHFEPLLFDAWRRVPNRHLKVVADAGYDGERYHSLARRDMNVQSIIPPKIGRPIESGAPPGGRWRREMKRMLATKKSRRRCGYNLRYQVETVNSMIKRNLGSALAGKTEQSRQRDMLLKVLTHNLMVLQ